MKKSSIIIVACVLLLVGCKEDDEYILFSLSEYVGEELLNCLNENDLEYKFDEEGNILVKDNDRYKAAARCS